MADKNRVLVENNARNDIVEMFTALYRAIFRTPSFRKALKFFGTSIASLHPETVILHTARHLYRSGPPERLSLAFVTRSYIPRDCETRLLDFYEVDKSMQHNLPEKPPNQNPDWFPRQSNCYKWNFP